MVGQADAPWVEACSACGVSWGVAEAAGSLGAAGGEGGAAGRRGRAGGRGAGASPLPVGWLGRAGLVGRVGRGRRVGVAGAGAEPRRPLGTPRPACGTSISSLPRAFHSSQRNPSANGGISQPATSWKNTCAT